MAFLLKKILNDVFVLISLLAIAVNFAKVILGVVELSFGHLQSTTNQYEKEGRNYS